MLFSFNLFKKETTVPGNLQRQPGSLSVNCSNNFRAPQLNISIERKLLDVSMSVAC